MLEIDSNLPTKYGAKPVISSEYVHQRAEDLDSSAALSKYIVHKYLSGRNSRNFVQKSYRLTLQFDLKM